jgi:hypothetical protein
MTAILPSGGESAVVRNEYFIEGTEPQGQTSGQGGQGILSRLFHSGNTTTVPAAAATSPSGNENTALTPPNADSSQQSGENKGSVLKKFLSIFKGKNPKPVAPPEAPKKTQPEG